MEAVTIPIDIARLAELRLAIKSRTDELKTYRQEAKACEQRIDRFLQAEKRDGVQVDSQVAIRETVKSNSRRSAPSEQEQTAVCAKYGIQMDENSLALIRELNTCGKPKEKSTSRIRLEVRKPDLPAV